MNIAIIGAGVTGLSVAYFLEQMNFFDYDLFEKENRVGGLCRSEKINGYIFDYTGHLLHVRDPYVEKLIKKLLGENIHCQERKAWIYYKNRYIPYPFQVNLHRLPSTIIKECLVDFIKAKYESRKTFRNFKEWAYTTFGDGIAKHFMIPYNEKLWTIPSENLSCEWIKDFVPQPSLEEVVEGALGISNKKFGYNPFF